MMKTRKASCSNKGAEYSCRDAGRVVGVDLQSDHTAACLTIRIIRCIDTLWKQTSDCCSSKTCRIGCC